MRTIFIVTILLLAVSPPATARIIVTGWPREMHQRVDLFTLINARGMEVKITNYGAAITAILVPGRDGKLTNVVQGFDQLEDYVSRDFSGRYGAIIGRYANRIKDDTFQIKRVIYHISRDKPVLETANRPYDERVWKADAHDGAEPQLTLTLIDPNTTMGFPGALRVQVTYTLTRNNILRINYHARSDRDTIISLTNHAYFNLAGDASGSVLDQLLTVNADAITAVDAKNVPTGEMRAVAGTAFDFRSPTRIGAHINDPDPAIQRAGGFDQNYAINGAPGKLRLAARLEDPKSGRVMEEWTTQAGLQVYSGNYPPPRVAVAKGYAIHSAVALEAQAFPNAPNVPSFPSAFLPQDTIYTEVTEYRFSVAP